MEPEKVVDLVNHIRTNCQSLELVGLMTIGSYDNSQSDDLNPDFEQLVKCKHEVCSKFDYDPDEFELSMGMSSDFETAVRCYYLGQFLITHRENFLINCSYNFYS